MRFSEKRTGKDAEELFWFELLLSNFPATIKNYEYSCTAVGVMWRNLKTELLEHKAKM
jgi:hypothetical protein